MPSNMMLDLETLALRVDAPIIAIGACMFDPQTGRMGATFERWARPNFKKFKPDWGTIQWWMAPAQTAAREIMLKEMAKAQDIKDVAFEFLSWARRQIDAKSTVWSHGATFDIPILAYTLADYGLSVPWGYRAPRDTRTLFDLTHEDEQPKLPFEGVQHTPLADAIHDAKRVMLALKRFELMEDRSYKWDLPMPPIDPLETFHLPINGASGLALS